MSGVFNAGHRMTVPLFPLGTVLFPDGMLPLKVFEQRYLEMTKACLRDDAPFGVCLIREGREVGMPAAPHSIGCLARIEQWDMPQPNMFHLLARGTERIRVIETSVAGNGLISASVEMLAPAERSDADADCVALVKRVISEVGPEHLPQPARLDDGAWVAYRMAEMLPLPLLVKHQLLELSRVDDWVREIKKLIKSIT